MENKLKPIWLYYHCPQGRLLGVACVTAGDYQMSVTEFTDDELLTELETITVQMAPSECLIPSNDNDDVSGLFLSAYKYT